MPQPAAAVTADDWGVVVAAGTVAELHGRGPAGPAAGAAGERAGGVAAGEGGAASGPGGSAAMVLSCRPSDAAVVVGRHPRSAVEFGGAAGAAGWSVVQRGSGGAAVIVVPGECVWVDVFVPRRHRWWTDDVNAAMVWLGRRWAEALGGLGIGAVVHTGGLHRPPLADVPAQLIEAVCFAGRGPGEVFDTHGAKLVGISQRRTARWVRLQSMVHLCWRAERYVRVAERAGWLRPGEPADETVAVLDGLVATVPAGADLVGALVAALRSA